LKLNFQIFSCTQLRLEVSSPLKLHAQAKLHVVIMMLRVRSRAPNFDLKRAHGGTEFCPWPGSFVLHDEYIRTTQITPLPHESRPWPVALIFDYRIRHRGLGNSGILDRGHAR
jgi:hypothetical protein